MLVSAIFTLVLIPSILRLPPVEFPRLLRRGKTTEHLPQVPVDV
jgi:hypothetical protein